VPKESVRLKRLVKHLPTSNSLCEAGIKAGYTKSVATSKIYTPTFKSKIIAELHRLGYTKEAVLNGFHSLSDLCITKEDYSNAMRGLENIAKIQGYSKDNTHQVALFNLTKQDLEELRSTTGIYKE